MTMKTDRIMRGVVAGAVMAAAALTAAVAGTRTQYRPSVSILGDSYSTFEGFLEPDTNHVWYFAVPDTARTDVSDVTQTWWHMFLKENGLRLCKNNSFSGATICYTGYRKEDYSNRSFLNRCTELGNPDMILIFGGTNDSWAKSPVGEYNFGKKTEAEFKAVRPALDQMLERVKNRYPNVDIYFIVNDGLSQEVTESIHTLCRRHGVPALQLEGIDKKRGHPTVKGMRQICDQLTSFLASEQGN